MQVLKLKEQLIEAEKEIQRLLERGGSDGLSSNTSPSSSFSMEPPFLGGEFGMEGLEKVFYVPESSYIPEMEWAGLYNYM